MKKLVVFVTGVLAFLTACTGLGTTAQTSLVAKSVQENYQVDTNAYYFPVKYFRQYRDSTKSDTFTLAWYSKMLRALQEPVLFKQPGEQQVYRLTCLRTFHPPFSIRIQQKSGAAPTMTLKIADGAGGYDSKNLVTNTTKGISDTEWSEFLQATQQADFWNLPTFQPDFGCDGSRWIIEGMHNGRYHVVDRWTPRKGTNYYALGNKFIGMSHANIRPLY